MTTGTPGFVGDRLREAREAIGITQASLAGLSDLSRQAVSQYERGDTTPNSLILERLSQLLQVPREYFFMDQALGHGLGEVSPVFFRSRKAELKVARQRARTRQQWLAGLVEAISRHVELPDVDIPDLGFSARPELITSDMVEYAANYVRRLWKLGEGPISNLIWLLENHGVIVASDDQIDPRLEAYSNWHGEFPIVMLGEEDRTFYRMRLSVAHELGHLVMHRRIDEARLQRRADLALLENQAFQFAQFFLFPRSQFEREVYSPSIDRMLAVKPIWGLSVQAQLMYAKSVGLVDGVENGRLWRSISRRGWRLEEPGDDRLQEQPMLLQRAVELILEEPSIPNESFFRQIPIGTRSIARFSGVAENRLRQFPPEPQIKAPSNIVAFPSSTK